MTTAAVETTFTTTPPRVRRVGAEHVPRWLAAAWRDFRHHAAASLGYAALVVGLLGAALWASWAAPQFVVAFVTGLLLVGPFLATGFYEISRRAGAGEPVGLGPVVFAWRRNVAGFGLFAVLLSLLMVLWVRFTSVLGALMFLGSGPGGVELSLHTLFTSAPGLQFLAVFLVSGALLAALAFVISVTALPMLLDGRADIVGAIATSVRVVRKNPGTMVVWAATIVAVTGLGIATGLIGLLIAFPLVGHATWHAYRDLVE